MHRRNTLDLETRTGSRTFELYEGDLTSLGRSVDVLVLSAFAGDYTPVAGTVVEAFARKLHLDIGRCATDAEFDLRPSLGVWISRRLTGFEFRRIVGAEFLGTTLPVAEVIENVFAALSLLEAKGNPVRTAALPVLGAGSQGLNAQEICRYLLKGATDFFRRSTSCKALLFVEINPQRADELARAMNEVLGRSNVVLPRQKLFDSLRDEITNQLLRSDSLFTDATELREDWLRVLKAEEARSFELGILGRRLLERMVRDLGAAEKTTLKQQIEELGKKHVAPWICAYMHVQRQIGTEAAHEGKDPFRRPPFVEQADLLLCLSCVARLLDAWQDGRLRGTPVPVPSTLPGGS
jgi:hypothetical protein